MNTSKETAPTKAQEEPSSSTIEEGCSQLLLLPEQQQQQQQSHMHYYSNTDNQQQKHSLDDTVLDVGFVMTSPAAAATTVDDNTRSDDVNTENDGINNDVVMDDRPCSNHQNNMNNDVDGDKNNITDLIKDEESSSTIITPVIRNNISNTVITDSDDDNNNTESEEEKKEEDTNIVNSKNNVVVSNGHGRSRSVPLISDNNDSRKSSSILKNRAAVVRSSAPTKSERSKLRAVIPPAAANNIPKKHVIYLRLKDAEADSVSGVNHNRRSSFLLSAFRPSARSLDLSAESLSSLDRNASSRGLLSSPSSDILPRLTVTWYDGTSSKDLYLHVKSSIARKVGKDVNHFRLVSDEKSNRIHDEEDIVLSPYIPSESKLIAIYTVEPPPKIMYRSSIPAPDSPSASPMTFMPVQRERRSQRTLDPHKPSVSNSIVTSPAFKAAPQPFSLGPSINSKKDGPHNLPSENGVKAEVSQTARVVEGKDNDENDDLTPYTPAGTAEIVQETNTNNEEVISNTVVKRFEMPTSPETSIVEEAIVNGQKVIYITQTPVQEKKHAVFVFANYFILFLTLITLSAELAERLPSWIESHVSKVNSCALDRDTLYECVSRGEISGIIAAISLWIAKSELTSRLLLFGFKSGNQLWAVVYESFVTGFAWGISYIFIRRGLNPDTRENFLQKYWKDAVYGSLAGFNAGFMKGVLKNLIPKEAIEEAVKESKRLRFIDWVVHNFE